MKSEISDSRGGAASATLIRAARSLGANLRVVQMVVDNAASFGDYLLCRTWDGTKSGAERIPVARPYKLRKTPFDGETRDGISWVYVTSNKRTATRVSDQKTETQVVTPVYRGFGGDAADTIYAVTGLDGGTDVVESGNEENPTKPVVWLDLNVDARAWAKESGTAGSVAGGVAAGEDDDASQLSYQPSVFGDWGGVDPGNIDDALDELAARIREVEEGGGGGAPTTVEYVVKTADAGLSAERVLTDVVRGGIKEDWGTAGELKLTGTSALFIVNATGAGTITGKTYDSGTSPASKVLNAFTSDNDSVTITVEVDAGPVGGTGEGWQPVVTVVGGTAPVVITNLAPIVAGTRRFTGTAVINATASGTIYATTDDGGQSNSVTYTRALDPPEVLTAIFAAQASGIYPGVQTQFKSSDTMRITGTTEAHATRVFLKNAGISDSLQGPFTVTAGAFDFTATVGARSSAAQTGRLYADTGSGTTAGPDFVTTNTADQDQTSPTFSSVSITYPVGQQALKNSETADVTITHTNAVAGDTYVYDDFLTGELTIPASTTYAATKTVTRVGGNYRDSGVNYRLAATRTTKNGKSASINTTVKIAHTNPAITVTGATARLRSRATGGDKTYTITMTSTQNLQATPNFERDATDNDAGTTALPAFAGSGKVWTATLTVKESDKKNLAAAVYAWASVSITNEAAKNVTSIGTNPNYTIGGFESRDVAAARFTQYVAIGTQVSNLNNAAKVTCFIPETGHNLTYVGSVTPTVDGFTITDSAGAFLATGNYVRCLDSNVYDNIAYTMRVQEAV